MRLRSVAARRGVSSLMRKSYRRISRARPRVRWDGVLADAHEVICPPLALAHVTVQRTTIPSRHSSSDCEVRKSREPLLCCEASESAPRRSAVCCGADPHFEAPARLAL